MGFIGGTLGYRILRLISPGAGACEGDPYAGRSKLDVLFNRTFWDDVRGHRILDFGCGYGMEVVEMAQQGASEVIGLDTRIRLLSEGRQRAGATAGLSSSAVGRPNGAR
jgi:SAM-dependent methyltransferase